MLVGKLHQGIQHLAAAVDRCQAHHLQKFVDTAVAAVDTAVDTVVAAEIQCLKFVVGMKHMDLASQAVHNLAVEDTLPEVDSLFVEDNLVEMDNLVEVETLAVEDILLVLDILAVEENHPEEDNHQGLRMEDSSCWMIPNSETNIQWSKI